MKYEVPQGSDHDPLLFSYIVLLLAKLHSFGIHFHCIADDTQMYVPVKADDVAQIRNVEAFLSAVKSWMSPKFQ